MLHISSLASTHLPRFLFSHPFAIHRESSSTLVNFFQTSSFAPLTISRHIRIRPFCLSPGSSNSPAGEVRAGSQLSGVEDAADGSEREDTSVGIGSPSISRQLVMGRISLGDQAFFLLSFIALMTSIAFASLVIAAVPTLIALKKAATSLARLSDTAREELPSTMAAIRLSGMEISDLTLELNDLSQEIADGVNKSAQAVHAAEAGLRQIGAVARQQTITMIQERANLPEISLRPMVAGAARKTSDAVGRARTKFINLLSRRGQAVDEKISSESEL